MRSGKVVMFDLGGVLVENRGSAQLTAMLPRPLEAEEIWRRWLASPSVRQFERGAMAADAFAAAFVEEWRIELDPSEFMRSFAAWPWRLFPGAEALLREVKARHHLACMSNTNALHWARFPELHALFDTRVLSHECGVLKPDREAFEHALAKLGAQPHDVCFLDDLQPNVDAARALGIRAFRVRAFAEIAPLLRSERLLGARGA